MKKLLLIALLCPMISLAQYGVRTRAVTVDGTTGKSMFPIADLIYTNGVGDTITNNYDRLKALEGSVIVRAADGSSKAAIDVDDAWGNAVDGDTIFVYGGEHLIGIHSNPYRSNISMIGIDYPLFYATNRVGSSNYAMFDFSRVTNGVISGIHFKGTVIGGAAHDYTYNVSQFGMQDYLVEDCIFQMDIQPTCSGMIQLRNWISHKTVSDGNNLMRNCTFVTLDRGTSCYVEHMATHSLTEWTFENCNFVGSAYQLSSDVTHQGKYINCAKDRDLESEYDYFRKLSNFEARAYMIPETASLLDSAGYTDTEAAPVDMNDFLVEGEILAVEYPSVSIIDSAGEFTEYFNLSLAITALQNGDTLTLNGGTHTGNFPSYMTNVTVVGINDPSITETITSDNGQGVSLSRWESCTWKGVIMDTTSTLASGFHVSYCCTASGAQNLLMEDCTFIMRVDSSGNTGAVGLSSQVEGTNNIVRNCTFITINGGGENNTPTHVFVFAPNDWLFDNCMFIGDARMSWDDGLEGEYSQCRVNQIPQDSTEDGMMDNLGRIGPTEARSLMKAGTELTGSSTTYTEAEASWQATAESFPVDFTTYHAISNTTTYAATMVWDATNKVFIVTEEAL